MSNVVPIKGAREAPKASRSSMETLIVSLEEVNQWRVPTFQRPLRINEKVRSLAQEIRDNGCEIPGVMTLGKIGKDPTLYIVDGQHRAEGFRQSGLGEAIVDIRICHFDSMAEMAREFVNLNSSLVKMRPDDILRGLESTVPTLENIKKACDFVGYDQIRRNTTTSPIVSMSLVLRCWTGSSGETPSANTQGTTAARIAEGLDYNSAQQLIVFLLTAHAAWGRDPEYYRLWSALNLTLCMWLWRRLVLDSDRSGNKRYVKLNPAQFKQCLMSVSADGHYLDWLQGRVMGDRDRSPAYSKLKQIFMRRLRDEARGKATAPKLMLPQPAWASR